MHLLSYLLNYKHYLNIIVAVTGRKRILALFGSCGLLTVAPGYPELVNALREDQVTIKQLLIAWGNCGL